MWLGLYELFYFGYHVYDSNDDDEHNDDDNKWYGRSLSLVTTSKRRQDFFITVLYCSNNTGEGQDTQSKIF